MAKIYNAFLSYSHAVDGRLAPALEQGLKRFARPLLKLRALSVFRDQASLSANPALWNSIERALDGSDYFILMASPEAAKSPWVAKEVEFWRREKTASRVLIALTDGEILWDDKIKDFDWTHTTAVPKGLAGMFDAEPLWIDLRWTRSATDISLHNPRFQDAVAGLAATIHGRPKDELVGEDVRQYRRARRLTASAVALLAILTIAAATAAALFLVQRGEALKQADLAEKARRIAEQNEVEAKRQQAVAQENEARAQHQRNIAVARQLAAQAALIREQRAGMLSRSALLAVESVRRDSSVPGMETLQSALRLLPKGHLRLSHKGIVMGLTFSKDNNKLATVGRKHIQVFDVSKWRHLLNITPENTAGESLFAGNEHFISSSGSKFRYWRLTEQKPLMVLDHGASIELMVTTEKGHHVATASRDRVSLWNVKKGETIWSKRFEIQDHQISEITFASNDKWLVLYLRKVRYSQGERRVPRMMRLFEVSTGREVSKNLFKKNFHALRVSPNGRWIVASSSEGALIQVFNINDLRKSSVLSRAQWGSPVVFSPDSERVATTFGNEVYVWNTDTGSMMNQLRHKASAWARHFSTDGRLLVTQSMEGFNGNTQCHVWDLVRGREVVRTPEHSAVQNYRCALSGNARLFAYDSFDLDSDEGGVVLAELGVAYPPSQLADDNRFSVSALNLDGKFVATAKGSIAQVWTSSSLKPVAQVEHPADVAAVAIDPEGRRIAIAGGRIFRIWKTDGELKIVEHLMKTSEAQLVFAPVGHLVAVSDGHFVHVFDAESGNRVTTVEHAESPEELLFSPDGRFLVTRNTRVARVWDSMSGRLVAASEDSAAVVAFSSDSVWLAIGGSGSTTMPGTRLRLWNLKEGKQKTFELKGRLSDLMFSPDRPWLVMNWAGLMARVLDVEKERDVALIAYEGEFSRGDPAATDILFHPDGRRLLTSAMAGYEGRGEVQIWDLPSGKMVGRMVQERGVDKMALSPDGRWLATSSLVGILRIWKLNTMEEIARLSLGRYIDPVGFTANNRWLNAIVLENDNTWNHAMLLWDPEEIIEATCSSLTRNLTCVEWKRYFPDEPYQATCPNIETKVKACE